MNAAGVTLVLVGIWLVAQVTAGKALERLNLVKGDGATGTVQG